MRFTHFQGQNYARFTHFWGQNYAGFTHLQGQNYASFTHLRGQNYAYQAMLLVKSKPQLSYFRETHNVNMMSDGGEEKTIRQLIKPSAPFQEKYQMFERNIKYYFCNIPRSSQLVILIMFKHPKYPHNYCYFRFRIRDHLLINRNMKCAVC